MITTLDISEIVGPIMALVGIGLLINTEFYRQMCHYFMDRKDLLFISGIIGLLFGIWMSTNHNIWTTTPKMIISFLGWAILIKSSLMLATPTLFSSMTSHLNKLFFTILFKLGGITYIAIGFYLTNYAYNLVSINF